MESIYPGNPSQASRGSDSLPAVSSGVCSPAASPASCAGTTSACRPSRPLVAMITVAAKSMITADQESCCVRRRYHIVGELVDCCIEAGVEDRNQQHAATGAVVEPHEQGAGEEQRDDLDSEYDGCRYQRLDSPALYGEVVGHVPHQGLRDIVNTAIARAPADRYPSASAFDAALGGRSLPAREWTRTAPHPGHEQCFTGTKGTSRLEVCAVPTGKRTPAQHRGETRGLKTGRT
jgi:hypothetical protein